MANFFTKNKKGILGTIAFHLFLIALFVFFGFHTPLPLPEEEGILINFGTEEDGFGFIEPSSTQTFQENEQIIENQETQFEESASEEVTEKIIAQDFEEAPAVEKKITEKKQVDNDKKQKTEEEQKTPVEKQREVNKRALYKGISTSNNSTQSEGVTTGQGNQGSITGSVESSDHTGGTGLGTKGISFSLRGRNFLKLPKPEYLFQVEGKVVVEVTVDRNGNVTQAEPGVKGSTTLDENLLNAAKKAALNSKFDKNPDAPSFQKGTITYIFHLK